jgi:hypothetical protein
VGRSFAQPDLGDSSIEHVSLRGLGATFCEDNLPVPDPQAGVVQFFRPWWTWLLRTMFFSGLKCLAQHLVQVVCRFPWFGDDGSIEAEILVLMECLVFDQVGVHFLNELYDVGA